MELVNDFEVKAPIDRAWTTLTDVELIAPCLPGAQLQEVDGDDFRGIVKVKVGPITAQYAGTATFLEKDDVAKRAVLRAEGRDTRGAGNAAASITAQLEPLGETTRVTVTTDLQVTGKVAQFGRGVMADVSSKLMGQFAANLEALMASESAAPTPGADAAEPGERPAARRIDMPASEPVNLLATAGLPVAKRVLPLVAVVVVAVIAWLTLR